MGIKICKKLFRNFVSTNRVDKTLFKIIRKNPTYEEFKRELTTKLKDYMKKDIYTDGPFTELTFEDRSISIYDPENSDFVSITGYEDEWYYKGVYAIYLHYSSDTGELIDVDIHFHL